MPLAAALGESPPALKQSSTRARSDRERLHGDDCPLPGASLAKVSRLGSLGSSHLRGPHQPQQPRVGGLGQLRPDDDSLLQ